jgi:ankyrin repeat protein
MAYRLKDKDLIRTLLNFGADPGLIEPSSNKCLTELIKSNASNSEEARQMKELLSDCFMQAIAQNNAHSVRLFLHSNIDLNDHEAHLPDGNSYLHWAVLYSNEIIVRLLLERGANVNSMNKFGATPLHECVAKRTIKEDTLRIIETLLLHKADATSIPASSGIYKDMSVLEFAASRTKNQQNMDIFNMLKEFLSEVSVSSVSSPPSSPSIKSALKSASDHYAQQNQSTIANKESNAHSNIMNALDAMSIQTTASSSGTTVTPTPMSPTIADAPNVFDNSKQTHEYFEQLNYWCSTNPNNATTSNSQQLLSLLWPRPQHCVLISEEERFPLANIKVKPILIYIKPPYTYACMDLINKLASSFSGMQFHFIYKPSNDEPYIAVSIDKTPFQQHESAYSILVKKNKIEINVADSSVLQYAFFTFMQLSKIFARVDMPSLKVCCFFFLLYSFYRN